MDPRVLSMIQQLLGRDATTEDRANVAKLIANLPPEVLASPAVLTDIVLRANMLTHFDRAIDKMSTTAQQRLHHDLPNRVEEVARSVFVKMRDMMPVDHADAVRRLLRTATILAIVVAVIAAAGGWMVHSVVADHRQASRHAATEQGLQRCIDAAEGAAAVVGHGSGGTRYDPEVYRTKARDCAAEYADRVADR